MNVSIFFFENLKILRKKCQKVEREAILTPPPWNQGLMAIGPAPGAEVTWESELLEVARRATWGGLAPPPDPDRPEKRRGRGPRRRSRPI